MPLSKTTIKVLTAVLTANTKTTAELLSDKKQGAVDPFGISYDEYEFWRNTYSLNSSAAVIILAMMQKSPKQPDLIAQCDKHLRRIYERKNSGVSSKLKSLSVLVLTYDHLGSYAPPQRPFIFIHSEKGYILETSGSIGNVEITLDMLKDIRAATLVEVIACVAGLNSAQQSQVISHQYFSEVRNAVLSE